MDIIALHCQSIGMRLIAKKLGLNRNTVKKLIPGKHFHEYRRNERRVSMLAPLVHVIQYWLGQNHYWVLNRLKPIGYEGSYKTLKKFIRFIKKQHFRIAYVHFETMSVL